MQEHRHTAVCIAGSLRTFLQESVQTGLAQHFHKPRYEYFVGTDAPRPARHQDIAGLRIGPLRAWSTVADGASEDDAASGGVSPCLSTTCNPQAPSHLRFARKIAACHAPMVQEEERRGTRGRAFRYGFVVRIRPDHLWLRSVPPIASLFSSSRSAAVLLWDDQAAAARRDDADAVLLAPVKIFSTCASAAEWKLACNGGRVHGVLNQTIDADWSIGTCRASGLKPCEPINLLVAFAWRADGAPAASSIDRLPFQMRTWRRGRHLPLESGDFCIKRQRFLVHDAKNDCRQNDGCMDC